MKRSWEAEQKAQYTERPKYREGSVLHQSSIISTPSTPFREPRSDAHENPRSAATTLVEPPTPSRRSVARSDTDPARDHPKPAVTTSHHPSTPSSHSQQSSRVKPFRTVSSREGLPYESGEDDFDEIFSDLDLFLDEPQPQPVIRELRTLDSVIKAVYQGDPDDKPIVYSRNSFMGPEITRYFRAHGYVEVALRRVEEVYKVACQGHNVEGSFVAMLAAEGMPADTARYIFKLARKNHDY